MNIETHLKNIKGDNSQESDHTVSVSSQIETADIPENHEITNESSQPSDDKLDMTTDTNNISNSLPAQEDRVTESSEMNDDNVASEVIDNVDNNHNLEHSTNVLKGQQLICAICQSDFEEDDIQVSLKRCKKNTHSFHISCLDRWEREQRFLYNKKPPQWKLLNPFLLRCTICKVIYKPKDRSDWNESQSRERNESAITPIDLTNDNQDTHIRNQNWRHSVITNVEVLNEAERIVAEQQSRREHQVLEHDITLREMYTIIGYETTGTRFIDETTRTYPQMAFSSRDLTGAVRRAMRYIEQYANDKYEEWVEEKEEESVEDKEEESVVIESDDDGSIYRRNPSDKPDIIDEINDNKRLIEKFLCAIANLWCFDMDLRNEQIIGRRPPRRNYCFCPFGKIMKPLYERMGGGISMNFLTNHNCYSRDKR